MATRADLTRIQLTDGELIRMTGEGDSLAFDQLYHRFAGRIFGWAFQRLRDRGSAEEATQETFTAIWRSASSYRPERGPGGAWLFAVARNAIVDQTRRRVPTPAELPDSASEEAGPSERAESAWASQLVHQAVAGLPEELGTLIELAYWRCLSQSEIATRLGVPIGTVKTRTRTALARLADSLDEERGLAGF
jgi:RNA polymerase sigma-70 factor (ECF subfamily)